MDYRRGEGQGGQQSPSGFAGSRNQERLAFLRQVCRFLWVSNLDIVLGQSQIERTLVWPGGKRLFEDRDGMRSVTYLLQAGRNAKEGFRVRRFGNSGVGEETDNRSEVLLGEIGVRQPGAGNVIGMIELQGAAEPYACFIKLAERPVA